MSYASLITEAADLALSMKAKTEQLYKASTHGTPTPVRASATIVSCELRTLTRRWRKVMDAIIVLDQAEHEAEVARNAELVAEDAALRVRYGLPAPSEDHRVAA